MHPAAYISALTISGSNSPHLYQNNAWKITMNIERNKNKKQVSIKRSMANE